MALSRTLVYIQNVLSDIDKCYVKKNDVLLGIERGDYDLPPSLYKKKYTKLFIDCVKYNKHIKAKIKKNKIEIRLV